MSTPPDHDPDRNTATAPAAAAPPARRRRRGLAWLAGTAAALGLVAAAGLGLVATEGGTRWLLGHLPGVSAQQVRGTLASGRLDIGTLRLRLASIDLEAQALRVRGGRLRWSGGHPALSLQELGAAAVTLRRPAQPAPAHVTPPPTSLRLPLRLAIAGLRVDRLSLDGLPPWRHLQAALALGADDGARHRLDGLRFDWERAHVQGRATLNADYPFVVDATLDAQADADAGAPPWAAQAHAQGPLAAIDLQASLDGRAVPGRAPPHARVHALLTPFAAVPLATITADTQALDLSALSVGAPATRLDGQLQLSMAPDTPPRIRATLRNQVPEAWSRGGLPFSALDLDLQVPWGRKAVNLPALHLQLADARGAAGTLEGHGRWTHDRAELQLDLADVQLGRLASGWADWRVDGPVQLSLDAPLALVSGAGATPPWQGRLAARLRAGPPGAGPLRLDLQATASASALALTQLQAQDGNGTLSADARLRHGAAGPWQGDARVRWSHLDPTRWWPLRTALPAALAGDLSGTLDARLDALPVQAPSLAAARGRLDLVLGDSRLAGVPLTAQAHLVAQPGPWPVAAELHDGANQATVAATLRPGAAWPLQALRVALDAPDLGTLAPAANVANVAGGRAAPIAWPTRGSAHATLEFDDRGARTLTTRGELRDWAGPGFSLAHLDWNGRAGTAAAAPLQLDLQAHDARWGQLHLADLSAAATGSLAAHQLRVSALAPVAPPLWLARLAGVASLPASRLDLQLDGHWHPAASPGTLWAGRLSRFELRALPGADGAAASAPEADAGTPWVQLDPLDLRLAAAGARTGRALDIGPGHASVAGLSLRWPSAHWAAAAASGGAAHWSLQAAVDPFAAAPLLARLQPGLAWQGDLQLGARVQASFDGAWRIDAQLARTAGDLALAESAGGQAAQAVPLGLTETRLALAAHDGAWQLDLGLAGSRLGNLHSRLEARAAGPGALPDADSPLQGLLQAHVGDLDVWSIWLPPAWRVGGRLDTEVRLAGSAARPQWSGNASGQQLTLRNPLQGLYARDGELRLQLNGDQARLERLHLVAGNGTLDVSGQARLGRAPDVHLQLQADHFQLLGQIDRRLVTSGRVDLGLDAEQIRASGRLRVDEGLIDLGQGNAPTLDSDVQVLDHGTEAEPGATASAAAPRPTRSVALALAVDLGDQLRLRGKGIDTLLKGVLQLSAPNGQLAVRGIVHTAGGTYQAYGQKLQVDRGNIIFSGPLNDPRLDILATRPNLDVVVGVAITGTALAPHVKLVSQPAMSDADTLTWLMLGRAPDGVGSADTALLQQAAIALLAGEGEAPTDKLMHRLGLTSYSVRQQQDANDVRQTVVSVGRQLSKRWYVGYEQSVNAAAGSFQLIYRIAQRLTVRVQSGRDVSTGTAGSSVDALYTWRWN